MVADNIKRTKRSRIPTKSLLPYRGVPEGAKGYYNNKQHKSGKENNQGLPKRVLLRNGTVEYSIRPPAQTPIYKAYKSSVLRRRFLIMVRAELVGEAENLANLELNKITKWAIQNKLIFQEGKSRVVVLLTRRKRAKRNSNIFE